MLCPGCGYGRLGDVRNAANGASTAVFWLARLAWVLVGVVAPWSALADGRSTVGAVSGQAIDLRFGLARRRRGRRGSPYGSLYIA